MTFGYKLNQSLDGDFCRATCIPGPWPQLQPRFAGMDDDTLPYNPQTWTFDHQGQQVT
jgi:hypothetical protein